MSELLYEPTIDLLAMISSAAGSLVFTIAGILVEQTGFYNLAEGATTIGVWETGMGAVLLFVGVYLLGYHQFWKRLHSLTAGP